MKIKKVLFGVISCTLVAGAVPVNIAYASESQSIITGVECGMTESEVIGVIGNDIVYTLDSSNISPEDNDYTNFYNTDTIELFNIKMSSVILTEFSGDNTLNGYGYNIGMYYDEETQNFEYLYSESALVEAYDQIYSQLVQWYGEGSDGLNVYGTIKECTWNTEYGDVWLVVGMDLFGESSGVNKVMLTCTANETTVEYVLGDVNSDNIINASDASEILAEYARTSSGKTALLSVETADVNNDNEVNASDASSVLAYYAYISSGGSGSLENFLKQ